MCCGGSWERSFYLIIKVDGEKKGEEKAGPFKTNPKAVQADFFR